MIEFSNATHLNAFLTNVSSVKEVEAKEYLDSRDSLEKQSKESIEKSTIVPLNGMENTLIESLDELCVKLKQAAMD